MNLIGMNEKEKDEKEQKGFPEQITKTKKLKRKPIKGDLMFGSDFDKERLERIPAILFGFQAPSSAKLKSNISNIYEKSRTPSEEQVDAVVVLDEGMIFNIKDARDPLNIEVDGERKLGLVGLDLGDKTLILFLFHLSQIVPREIRMGPDHLALCRAFRR